MTEKTDITDLINPDDFRSIEIKIDYENLTTRVAIKDGKKIFGTKTEDLEKGQEIQFLEFLEPDGFVMECPPNSGAKGHNIGCQIQIKLPSETIAINITGRITEVEKLPTNNQRFDVKLTQYESGEWNRFLKIFAKRQEEILEFFNNVKGA